MADDLLVEFINESREHLATIETDLLAIEEGGANINEELVNKVFRAAHSIKGGSSFFGLTKVKELAHKAETVLDMMRCRKLAPNAESTNILLAAFDKLRDMINAPGESASASIDDLVAGLTGLASSYLPQDKKATLTKNVALKTKDQQTSISLAQVDVERARRNKQCIYRVEYDLIHDIEKQGLTILQVFRELEESGEIMDCIVDVEAAGTLDDPIGKSLPVRLVFATTIAPEIVHELLALPREKVSLLFDPMSTPEASAPASAPAEMPAPAAVPEVPRPAETVPVPSAPAAVSVRPDHDTHLETIPAAETAVEPAKQPTTTTEVTISGGDETIRVNVMLLETLMNLAGELVLSRNQLRAAISQSDLQSLSVADQRINQVTSELQDAIMRTRLQPIGNVFGKFPRVARDLSNSLQKEIHLDIRGKDVAMDRSLIEGLSDPLTHMVRNAVDHGIELPADRLRAGKKPAGTVRIEARHEAGQVVVEIADDGKGIDGNRVAKSAISKGLISAEKVQSMSDQEKIALIFLPGLSTAEKVTEISGRGVGMDVVKTNLDKLGGKIEIRSELGRGSIFRIKLPLTLAIIPSLIVSVNGERFAIPQTNVDELLRIRAEDVKSRIEVVGGAEVLLLRDSILPLLRFDRFLSGNPGEVSKTTSGPLEIAVVTTGTMQYGLVVEGFHDTEEIVVKPLGRHLKALREYAGATILGDGAVALILDIAGLAAKMDLSAVAKKAAQEEEDAPLQLEDSLSLLLFRNAPDEICAIPLNTVLRIERITPAQVETVGSRRTFQYRGSSLPLVTLADVAQVKQLGEAKELAVIVSSVHGHEVGLLGAMPVDVVETKVTIDTITHRQKGIAGSAIIRERTTLIADIRELVDAVYPEWGAPKQLEAPTAAPLIKNSQPFVLLAEDSDFFRAQVKKYLEEDGYHVLAAPDGEEAWNLLLEHADEIQAVITDVEMPRLTGLDLAQRIRAHSRVSRLPVIALSSLASEEDCERGKAAGVNDYQVKLDRDRLLASLHAMAEQRS